MPEDFRRVGTFILALTAILLRTTTTRAHGLMNFHVIIPSGQNLKNAVASAVGCNRDALPEQSKGGAMSERAELGKSYWSCEWQEGGLTFSAPSVHVCCITHHNGLGAPQLLRPYKGEHLDIEKLIYDRNAIRLRNQRPERNPACAGCGELRKIEWPSKPYPFDVINLSHWRKCNLKCSYCYTVLEPEMPELDEPYHLLPIMQQMIEEKALAPGAHIYWGGGEPTVLSEFEDLFNLFHENGMYQHLNTNGVVLSKVVLDALPMLNGEVMISVDAGTAETYRALKVANAFEKVMRTIEAYAGAAPDKFVAKFILKDENYEEVIKFLDRVEKAGVRTIRVDVDNHESTLKESITNAGRTLADAGRKRGMTVHVGGCGDIGFPENEMRNKVARVVRLPSSIMAALSKLRGAASRN